MRVLVTGAAGFIGSHLVPELVREHEVIAVTRPGASPPDVETVELDIGGSVDLRRLPRQVDAIVHLAQSARYREFPAGAEDVFQVNVRGTFDLLEYARLAGAQQFVFTSTGGVYGTSYERFVETDTVSPLNLYLTSKYCSELLLANYREFFRTVVLRPFFVYGPGQNDRMLVPRLAGLVHAGEEVTIEGRPGLRINPIYVTDAVRVCAAALAYDRSEVFNVAGMETVDMTELVERIGRALDRSPTIAYRGTAGDGDLVGDISRMRKLLGVTPTVSLDEGLARAVGS